MTERKDKMKDYNYLYYEKQATDAFVCADETNNNARAQLFLLDSIARSLACIADVIEHSHGVTEPKEADYDIGSVDEDDNR